MRALKPERLLIVDAADIGLNPGEIRIIDPDDIADMFIMSTHNLPLNFLIDQLKEDILEVIFRVFSRIWSGFICRSMRKSPVLYSRFMTRCQAGKDWADLRYLKVRKKTSESVSLIITGTAAEIRRFFYGYADLRPVFDIRPVHFLMV